MFYVTDQNAKDFADDGFGGKNSVLVVDDSFDKVIIKKGDHSLSSPKWLGILKKELKIIIN